MNLGTRLRGRPRNRWQDEVREDGGIAGGKKKKIQWRYSPTGPWPTERPPPVSEASANFCG